MSYDGSCDELSPKIILAVWSLIITFWAFSLNRLTGLLAKHTQALAWIQKCRLVLNSSISPSKRPQILTTKIEFHTFQALLACCPTLLRVCLALALIMKTSLLCVHGLPL